MEANRVLRNKGYYIIALQWRVSPERVEALRKGIASYGFSVTQMSNSYYGIYGRSGDRTNPFNLIVAQKIKDASKHAENSEDFVLQSTRVKLVKGSEPRKIRSEQPVEKTDFCKNFLTADSRLELHTVLQNYLGKKGERHE